MGIRRELTETNEATHFSNMQMSLLLSSIDITNVNDHALHKLCEHLSFRRVYATLKNI